MITNRVEQNVVKHLEKNLTKSSSHILLRPLLVSGVVLWSVFAGVCVGLAILLAGTDGIPAAQAREASVEELEKRKAWDAERRKAREERQRRRGSIKAAKKSQTPAQEIAIGFLTQAPDIPPALSNLDPVLLDEGEYGAELGIEDNNTTGQFLNQKFVLTRVNLPRDGDLSAAFIELAATNSFIITHLPADHVLALADLPQARDIIILNASASDDSLRGQDCRANIFHIIPSRAMHADALAQFLVKKKWDEWFLVIGPRPDDELFAAAIRHAAEKFGAEIVEEKTWDFEADIRRTAKAELPVFTRGADYDILIVADEQGRFGEYLPYNTWEPKLIAGTQGLVPTAWGRTHEQWGAIQMQNRFRRASNRWMTPVDYAAWTATRAIGEAVSRIGSGDPQMIRDYLRSDAFNVAAYKGQKLTFRDWDQQLRQPILLAAARAMVSVSPQPGFLHPERELDTLGTDRALSECRLPQ